MSPHVEIGGGLFLPHTVGKVIGAEQIGGNVTILQGVTLGTKKPEMQFAPPYAVAVGARVKVFVSETQSEQQ